MVPQFAVERLSAALEHEHHAVFAVPFAVA